MADERPKRLGNPGASALLKAQQVRERRQLLSANRTGLERLVAALLPSEMEEHLCQEEHNWTTGGESEQILSTYLARRCPGVPMLHDRRAPGGRWNIDHIAVAPSGIYVIDCKRYKGRVEIARPLFGSAKLKINGRDKTNVISALDRQVACARAAIADIGQEVCVYGCLCFVAPEGLFTDSGLPLFRTLRLNGYPLYYPTRLARRLDVPGPLTEARALELQAELAQRLPQARGAWSGWEAPLSRAGSAGAKAYLKTCGGKVASKAVTVSINVC